MTQKQKNTKAWLPIAGRLALRFTSERQSPGRPFDIAEGSWVVADETGSAREVCRKSGFSQTPHLRIDRGPGLAEREDLC